MPGEPVRVGDPDADPRAWAHRLRRRELFGERLTDAQRAMWRSALRGGAKGEQEEGEQNEERRAA